MPNLFFGVKQNKQANKSKEGRFLEVVTSRLISKGLTKHWRFEEFWGGSCLEHRRGSIVIQRNVWKS